MNVLFLCKEQDLTAERRGYARALRKRVGLSCLPADFPTDGQLDQVLRQLSEQPALIVHPDAVGPALPRGSRPTILIGCFASTAATCMRRIERLMIGTFMANLGPQI